MGEGKRISKGLAFPLASLLAACTYEIEAEMGSAELVHFENDGFKYASNKDYLVPEPGAETVRIDINTDRDLRTLRTFRDLDFTVRLLRCGAPEPDFALGVPGRWENDSDQDVWSVFIDQRAVELARKKYFPDLFGSREGTYCLVIEGGSMTGMTARSPEMELSERHLILLQSLVDEG